MINLSCAKSYQVLKVRELKIAKGVMTCDVLPVAMCFHLNLAEGDARSLRSFKGGSCWPESLNIWREERISIRACLGRDWFGKG